ncbi:MAG TPA: L,D-transpeptidase family protein [Pyrinomonadaceae bacterium]|nr:L,D-transpeptidase family protein [Pyrinomonadaceae bacterium]
MKSLLTIPLILLLTLSVASAQTSTQIREAESRLKELGYWTGAIDGRFDPATRSALIAFQKWQGRSITGKLTIAELEAIRTSSHPQAREVGYEHVEVDLDRQVLLLVNEDNSVRVLPVSTGNDKPFVYDGQTSIAYTARGRFLVYEKEVGWGPPPFGETYFANYISGGVAIHGSRSVPNQPASHGCIRVPMFAARELSKLLPVGTIVLVYDKVSFVSAKPWVENPELKQAALLNASTEYFDNVPVKKPDSSELRARSKPSANKKARARIIRAGLRFKPNLRVSD